MSPETRTNMMKTVEREYPLFDLLNMEYINLDESFFTPTGEDWLRDGKIYFKFDKSKIPNSKLNLICHNVMMDYLYDTSMQPNDEFCIMYDTEDNLANGMEDKTKGGLTNFAIRRNDKIYTECGGTVGSILLYMNSLKHPKLEEAKEKVNKFAHECYDWIKEKIQKTLMINVKGNFVVDNIEVDTYFQRRCNGDICYDYIIHEWLRRMSNNETITWADLMGEGKIYVAIN